jgi:DNA polymerase-1
MIYFIGKSTNVSWIENTTIEHLIEYFKDKDEIGFDTETTGFDPYTDKLLSYQLGDMEHQFVVDASMHSISLIKDLLLSKLLIIHNAKFDLRFCYHYGIYPTKVYDTFLAECILTTGIENRELSLKSVVERYYGVTLDKTVRGVIHKEGLTERVIVYGAKDVKYLPITKTLQLNKIEKYGLGNILNLENNVVKVFAKMEYVGVPFNKTKWNEIATQVEQSVKDLELELDSIVYKEGTKDLPKTNKLTKYCVIYKQSNLFFDDVERNCIINWGSPSQKTQLLNDLGFNIESIGDMILQKLKSKHPIVPLLIKYSKQNKLATSFGKEFLKFVNPVTQRLHGNVWQILSTGRISISEPNINQIPGHGELAVRIRSAFEAPEGYKFVGGDYSGMELRIIAELSQDPFWLDVFNRGGDLHSELCAATFNIPIGDVKKSFPPKPEFKYRDVQKTVDFGLSYGMSEFKLADTMQIPVTEAKGIIKQFFSIVPGVERFLNALGNFGKTKGFIRSARPFLRIRWFPTYKSNDFATLGQIERASKNTPIQATNADIIKLAMVNIDNLIVKNNYPVQIVMQVYDELQTICKEEFAESWKVILQKEMIDAAKVVIKTIPVEVDCKISQCWSK